VLVSIGLPRYDYLNCLQINPCWGWLNSNATVRNATTQHAEALSAVYPQIIATQQYNSFKMYALTVDWQEIFDKWIAAGNDPVDLIEPTDGMCVCRSEKSPAAFQTLYIYFVVF
jgi:acyloxyacyl hydrolase